MINKITILVRLKVDMHCTSRGYNFNVRTVHRGTHAYTSYMYKSHDFMDNHVNAHVHTHHKNRCINKSSSKELK